MEQEKKRRKIRLMNYLYNTKELRIFRHTSRNDLLYVQVYSNMVKFGDFLSSGYFSLTPLVGCTYILETKYENDPEVRKIPVDSDDLEIKKNTIKLTITQLLRLYFRHGNVIEEKYISNATDKFEDEIVDKLLEGETLGDIIDLLNVYKKRIPINIRGEKFGL